MTLECVVEVGAKCSHIDCLLACADLAHTTLLKVHDSLYRANDFLCIFAPANNSRAKCRLFPRGYYDRLLEVGQTVERLDDRFRKDELL